MSGTMLLLLVLSAVGGTAVFFLRRRLFRVHISTDEYAWGMGYGPRRRRRSGTLKRTGRALFGILNPAARKPLAEMTPAELQRYYNHRAALIGLTVSLMAIFGYFVVFQAKPLFYLIKLKIDQLLATF